MELYSVFAIDQIHSEASLKNSLGLFRKPQVEYWFDCLHCVVFDTRKFLQLFHVNLPEILWLVLIKLEAEERGADRHVYHRDALTNQKVRIAVAL